MRASSPHDAPHGGAAPSCDCTATSDPTKLALRSLEHVDIRARGLDDTDDWHAPNAIPLSASKLIEMPPRQSG